MSVPEGMTPEKLRTIADWLDTYDHMAEKYITAAMMSALPLEADRAERVREVVRSSEIQDELRQWANAIEADG